MNLAELKYYLGENPIILPSVFVSIVLLASVPFVMEYQASAEYSEVIGTVCCLSERNIVYSAKRNNVGKAMLVDLDSGPRVEVPIKDIPYIPNRKILLRYRSKADIYGSKYQAIRYK